MYFSKDEKILQAFYLGLFQNSQIREIIEKDQNLLQEILTASVFAIAQNSNLTKNVILINSILHADARSKKRREREIERINSFVADSTKIERACLKEYIFNGYSSSRKLKYVRKLFLSILRNYARSNDKSFQNDGISLTYLCKYYQDNLEDIRLKMIYLPTKYEGNSKADIRISKLLEFCNFRITKLTRMYTRMRYKKYAFKCAKGGTYV